MEQTVWNSVHSRGLCTLTKLQVCMLNCIHAGHQSCVRRAWQRACLLITL